MSSSRRLKAYDYYSSPVVSSGIDTYPRPLDTTGRSPLLLRRLPLGDLSPVINTDIPIQSYSIFPRSFHVKPGVRGYGRYEIRRLPISPISLFSLFFLSYLLLSIPYLPYLEDR